MSDRPRRPRPKFVEKLEARREEHRDRHPVYRAAFAIAGTVVLLAGIVMLVTPGPAFVLIPIGLAMLSMEFAWAAVALDKALEQALRGDGTLLLAFADQYVDRGPDGYVDNSSEAIYAVTCLDNDEVVTPRELRRIQPRFEAASPTFGRMMAYGTTACSQWPVRSGRTPHELHAPGAAPILVVGTTRDPATPGEWAESLAAQLDSGVLVTRDGDGHTGYGSGNACVDDAVERYLVSGIVPRDGLAC